jgi:hypothetical protein
MSLIDSGSMPAKGSSSRMIEGLAASARAISQRRRSPPESAMAGVARSWVSAEFAEQPVQLRPRTVALSGSTSSSTQVMFCSTVMPRKIEVSCGR